MKSIRIDRIGLMQSACRDINDHPRTLVGGSSETLERVEKIGEVTWRQIIAEGEKEVEEKSVVGYALGFPIVMPDHKTSKRGSTGDLILGDWRHYFVNDSGPMDEE